MALVLQGARNAAQATWPPASSEKYAAALEGLAETAEIWRNGLEGDPKTWADAWTDPNPPAPRRGDSALQLQPGRWGLTGIYTKRIEERHSPEGYQDETKNELQRSLHRLAGYARWLARHARWLARQEGE